jgi:hypothetical protein
MTGLAIAGCGPANQRESAPAPESVDSRVAHLLSWMQGSFSSRDQAEADGDFHDIRLHMVRIWPGRGDGPWLYVEQAAGDSQDKPYRQRVYRLVPQPDGGITSEVYTFASPLRFAGAWTEEAPLAALTPDSLAVRQGCAVYLRWHSQGRYFGSTRDQDCQSQLRGASYATSEVTILPDKIISWDRGFDAAGEQVWGAIKGGYVFTKISDEGE